MGFAVSAENWSAEEGDSMTSAASILSEWRACLLQKYAQKVVDRLKIRPSQDRIVRVAIITPRLGVWEEIELLYGTVISKLKATFEESCLDLLLMHLSCDEYYRNGSYSNSNSSSKIESENAKGSFRLTACLREMDKSDVIIGVSARCYGWLDNETFQRCIDNAVDNGYAWVDQCRDISFYEILCQHAHLRSPGKKNVFFFIRSKKWDNEQMKNKNISENLEKHYEPESSALNNKNRFLEKMLESATVDEMLVKTSYSSPQSFISLLNENMRYLLAHVVKLLGLHQFCDRTCGDHLTHIGWKSQQIGFWKLRSTSLVDTDLPSSKSSSHERVHSLLNKHIITPSSVLCISGQLESGLSTLLTGWLMSRITQLRQYDLPSNLKMIPVINLYRLPTDSEAVKMLIQGPDSASFSSYEYIFVHSFSCSSMSDSCRAMLYRLERQLALLFVHTVMKNSSEKHTSSLSVDDIDFSANFKDLEVLQAWMQYYIVQMGTVGIRVVIVLEALQHINCNEDDGISLLRYLPLHGANIIVSTFKGVSLRSFSHVIPHFSSIKLEQVSSESCIDITGELLQARQLNINEEHTQCLSKYIDKEHIFVRATLYQLQQHQQFVATDLIHSAENDRNLNDYMKQLMAHDTAVLMFDGVVNKIEKIYIYPHCKPGHDSTRLVRDLLGLLVCMRIGLMEEELCGILNVPACVVSPIIHYIEAFVANIGGLLYFIHSKFKEYAFKMCFSCVEFTYEDREDALCLVHQQVIRYYKHQLSQGHVSDRIMKEYPWLLERTHDRVSLISFLVDQSVFSRMFSRYQYELISFWNRLDTNGDVMCNAYKKVLESSKFKISSEWECIGKLLEMHGGDSSADFALQFYYCLLEHTEDQSVEMANILYRISKLILNGNGKADDAIVLLGKSAMIRSSILCNSYSRRSIRTVVTVDLLGIALSKVSRHYEARKMFEQSLEISNFVSPESPLLDNVLLHLINIGITTEMNDTELFSYTSPLCERLLQLRQKYYSKTDGRISLAWLLVGRIQLVANKFALALNCVSRTLDIQKVAYGKVSAEYAETMEVLATIKLKMNLVKEATELQENACRIYENIFGINNLYLGHAVHKLANMFLDNDNTENGVSMLWRSLSIIQNSEANNDVKREEANILSNLGLFFFEKEALSEALPLLRRALEVRDRYLEENSPLIRSSLCHLIHLLDEIDGESDNAISLARRNFALVSKYNSDSRYEMCEALELLIRVLLNAKKTKSIYTSEALQHCQKLMEIQYVLASEAKSFRPSEPLPIVPTQNVPSRKHGDLSLFRENNTESGCQLHVLDLYAEILAATGSVDEAVSVHMRVIERIGESHSDTASQHMAMARLYFDVADYKSALKHFISARDLYVSYSDTIYEENSDAVLVDEWIINCDKEIERKEKGTS